MAPTVEASPRIAIFGAGAAGICTAIKLIEAGLDDITMFEKSDGVGGTWRANTYPGAACDVPSHLYAYSFASKGDWTRKFAQQPEILAYFEEITDRYGLRRLIRFNTEVRSATFDENTGTWRVVTDAGAEDFDVVVSGLGQLNRAYVPEIDGLSQFAGDMFHSAHWDHSVDLSGRRVAVVGNGASALQFIPHVAEQASELTVFQRSANWVIDKRDGEYPGWRQRMFARFPATQRLHRWSIYWRLEANFALLRRSSRAARLLERVITRALEPVTAVLPSEAVIPDYPIGCKRILLSSDYYAALMRDNVHVELDHIDHIEPDAVVTVDGRRHEVDTIIWGTGFRSTEFLAPMTVIGRDGRDLNEAWAKGAVAYLGVAVAGFPNLFMLYGPNTNLGHNSIIFMIEQQSRYIVEMVKELRDQHLAWIDVRRDAMDRYNVDVQRRAGDTVWVASCDSWYKNEHGIVTNNWPAFTVTYWKRMRGIRRGDHVRRHRAVAATTSPELRHEIV